MGVLLKNEKFLVSCTIKKKEKKNEKVDPGTLRLIL